MRAKPNATSQSTWQASAPGRVNLIGEHTDYNFGFTLPMAIHRYTTITAESAPTDDFLTFSSEMFPGSVVFSLDGSRCLSQKTVPTWSRYLAGVVFELTKVGFSIPPMRIVVRSDVPLGAGVSSSASLEVAMAVLLQKVTGRYLSGLDTALLCQLAEHQHVGVPCGLMDQLASVSGMAGHLMLMDCRTNSIKQVALPPELALIIVDSRVKHKLADGEYRQRHEQCQAACQLLKAISLRDVTLDDLQRCQNQMPEMVFRRARHVVTENGRTIEAASRILRQQWQAVGELMYLSHESMRQDFEISTPEIDSLVEIAHTIGEDQGVFGSRMTGGGFGGSTVTLALAESADSILEMIVKRYRLMTGIEIDGFVTQPADGAYALHRQSAAS
jgi:galactokinase